MASPAIDRKSTRLNSSHMSISYAVFCLSTEHPLQHQPDKRRFLLLSLPGYQEYHHLNKLHFRPLAHSYPTRRSTDLDRHPVLSERRNIVVIANEAHRSQNDFVDGFARH